MKRQTTEFEQDVFDYLNLLRESGVTNMFGARPYIMKDFKLSEKEAGKLLSLWMANFSEIGNYEEIEDKDLVET